MSLNPQTAEFLAMLAANAPADPPPQTPEVSRQGYRGMAEIYGPGPQLQSVKDAVVRSADADIPIRIYKDHDEASAPCLIYMHGGGWVIGDLETHDKECRLLAQKARCTVIAIDYRLGPEAPFPAGHIDCLEVLRAVAGHPEDYGVDPNRIAVGGDSAGGNLAAFLAIAARDEGIPLAFQVLIYPVTDARSYLRGVDQFDYASITENQEGPLLTLEGMRFFLEHTLTSEDPSAEATDWRISPMLATDLAGVAPALVATCGLDPLRDEGNQYAERLMSAGVKTELTEWAGQPHVLFQMSTVTDDGLKLVDHVATKLAEALGIEP